MHNQKFKIFKEKVMARDLSGGGFDFFYQKFDFQQIISFWKVKTKIIRHYLLFWSDGLAIASGGPLNSGPSLSVSLSVSLISHKGLFACLPPDTNVSITWSNNKIITYAWNCEAPNFTEKLIKHKDLVIGITINHLDFSIFWCCEDIMSVFDEAHRSDAVRVKENALMDITKLHPPYLKIFVSRASRQQLSIWRDIKGQHR